jgi:SAM-dependent methyltransferase
VIPSAAEVCGPGANGGVTDPALTAYGDSMGYAGAEFWDRQFERRRESGEDLNWNGVWTEPFLFPLRAARVHRVLEVGCGTGNDAARIGDLGCSVVAIDLSREAIAQARAKYGAKLTLLVADMSQRLPFADGAFDAVMSNVALHMFPDRVTRMIFAEVQRVTRPAGLFLFHVNAIEDRPLRASRLPARELEPNYVLEESGQTVHFFSEQYLRELLHDWQEVSLDSVRVSRHHDGRQLKQVWRGIARR